MLSDIKNQLTGLQIVVVGWENNVPVSGCSLMIFSL